MINKKLTIKVNTKDLDAMEDYLTVDFESNVKEQIRCWNATMKIWKKLVKAWGKK